MKPVKAGVSFSINLSPNNPETAPATTQTPLDTTPATTPTPTPTTKARSTPTTAPFVPLAPPVDVTPATPGQVVAGAIILTPDPTASTVAPVIAAVAAPKTTLPPPTTATTTPTTKAPIAPSTATPATATTTKAPVVYTFIEPSEAPPAPNPRAADVVALALSHLAEPYLWGGEGVGGWDCSGLSMVAWASVGVRLTHNSFAQFSQTARVARDDVQPGDIVFYGSPIHHLGIALGDGKMVEAAREGVPVRISSIKRKDLVGIGRVR